MNKCHIRTNVTHQNHIPNNPQHATRNLQQQPNHKQQQTITIQHTTTTHNKQQPHNTQHTTTDT